MSSSQASNGKRRIGVVTISRADYSHLYWPMRELSSHPGVELGVFVLGPHLSPSFGLTIAEIERDGFPIQAHMECLLSSDSDTGMAKMIGVAILSHMNWARRAIENGEKHATGRWHDCMTRFDPGRCFRPEGPRLSAI